MHYPDDILFDILRDSRCVACVGLSLNEVRPSYFVGRYLSYRGYRVIPVHPRHTGETFFGETVYGALQDIPDDVPVDMIDIFRRSEFVAPIVDEAMAHLPSLRVIWMQISVMHAQAAAKAEAQGFQVVQNRCPKLEYQRLFGELRRAGVNTRIISSKLPPLI